MPRLAPLAATRRWRHRTVPTSAAFAVGYFMLGYDDKEILAAFPSSIVLTIVGVTYFFGMAEKNGTIDLLVNAYIRAVRGRVTVVPWVFFFCASVLTALGTFSPAAAALISPAAMSSGTRPGRCWQARPPAA